MMFKYCWLVQNLQNLTENEETYSRIVVGLVRAGLCYAVLSRSAFQEQDQVKEKFIIHSFFSVKRLRITCLSYKFCFILPVNQRHQ